MRPHLDLDRAVLELHLRFLVPALALGLHARRHHGAAQQQAAAVRGAQLELVLAGLRDAEPALGLQGGREGGGGRAWARAWQGDPRLRIAASIVCVAAMCGGAARSLTRTHTSSFMKLGAHWDSG